MLKSMTGFGKSVVKFNDIIIETEVKSLNSRFLELNFRIPKSLTQKEFEIRELIKNKLNRGKVFIAIFISRDPLSKTNSFIDQDGLEKAVSILTELKQKLNLKGSLKIENLISFQNLFLTETTIDEENEFKYILQSISDAIDEMNKMRLREGEELGKDLLNRANIIEEKMQFIQNRNPQEIIDYFNKLKEKAKQLTLDIIDNPDRLNLELALLSEKYDITEECVRLKSHLLQFRDTIKIGTDAGRKLNFLCQEMNREANTINSKSISPDVTYAGISIKDELEKIREQIQNIE
ncbi:MAG TPA: YicC family protein [Melioribacteraceae bacterium]|nr:YicC family protein [Melioribacteraceae bacterium]